MGARVLLRGGGRLIFTKKSKMQQQQTWLLLPSPPLSTPKPRAKKTATSKKRPRTTTNDTQRTLEPEGLLALSSSSRPAQQAGSAGRRRSEFGCIPQSVDDIWAEFHHIVSEAARPLLRERWRPNLRLLQARELTPDRRQQWEELWQSPNNDPCPADLLPFLCNLPGTVFFNTGKKKKRAPPAETPRPVHRLHLRFMDRLLGCNMMDRASVPTLRRAIVWLSGFRHLGESVVHQFG